MKVFLNAGHGGIDPGAVSINGTKEAIITYDICTKLNDILIKNRYNTTIFQQKKSILEISQKEHLSNSDLFISIHCNSHYSKTANGVEVLYYSSSKKGKIYANIMQNTLVAETKLRDRGIIPNKTLYVLKETKAPAILIELAFISNPKEELLLKNNQELFINAIYKGIEKIKQLYINQN